MHCSYISRTSPQLQKQLHQIIEITVARPFTGLFCLSGSKIQGILKKYSENFVDYFPPSKNGMTRSVGAQKLFDTIVVRSKPPIAKIGICY